MRVFRDGLMLGAFVVGISVSAHADQYAFSYTNAFTGDSCIVSGSSGGTCTTGNELNVGGYSAFTLTGQFDTATGNEVAGVGTGGGHDGFLAYKISSATLTIGGTAYTFDPTGQDISFAMFGANSGFGPPGGKAAGFLLSAITDQNGSIADYGTLSNPALSTSVIPEVFSGFNGAGQGPSSGYGGIVLDSGGSQYTLELNSYHSIAAYAPSAYASVTSTASVAMPEPSSALLLLSGALPLLRRRRNKV